VHEYNKKQGALQALAIENISMLLRPLREEEKDIYNSVVHHPLQTWEWGNFRQQTGIKVERVGFFQNGKLDHALQVFFHPIPGLGSMTAGYFPKGQMPDDDQLSALKQLGKKYNAVFVKMEPDVGHKVDTPSGLPQVASFLQKNGAVPGRPLFTKYTFQLNLTPTEDELFANLSSKTRYNVNLAFKKGVQIFENSTPEGMETYLKILAETTKRQGFYAHSPEYFHKMWETLGTSGKLRIFEAVHEGQVLVSWIMFMFDGVLYYPYGASRDLSREVMASNLMMWEMIKFGKQSGCRMFDMWGSLGPNPDSKDAWFGFHRFKKGYGGDLIEFLGTYDLVTNPPIYMFYKIAENWRWKYLRLKAKLHL
jgi:lipid II:glycine glycyltransferase (peptidoglycan interpeptide bridge formation enzyme)